MIAVLREMILGVTAAAIFSAVMLQLADKSALQEVVRLAAGMVLILALLTPLSRLTAPHFSGWFAQSRQQVTQQTAQAQARNEALARSNIAGAVSKYLTEQAESMAIPCKISTTLAQGADGTVEIAGITVRGQDIGQAQRAALTALITENCGVAAEQVTFVEE